MLKLLAIFNILERMFTFIKRINNIDTGNISVMMGTIMILAKGEINEKLWK